MANLPTPTQRLLSLRTSFTGTKDLEVLRHALGNTQQINIDPIARQIAEHTVVVCIDVEHWSRNTADMTEMGICTIARQDLLPVIQSGNLGEHGDNVMKAAKFYFYRMIEKSHMRTTNPHSRGAEGNRFGEARFITFHDLRIVLHGIFNQDIPGMPGCKKPIIILGHAIGGDLENLNQGKDISYNVGALETVVKYLDTQHMVRERKLWNSEEGIRLEYLVAKLEFLHSDHHTACNDAARTLMSAIQLVLPTAVHRNCHFSMEEIADGLETYSQTNFRAFGPGNGYGSAAYCWRCGSHQHRVENCQATGLRCEECVSRGLTGKASEHIKLHCPIVAEEEVQERLEWYKDQPTPTKGPKVPFASRLTTYGVHGQTFVASPDEVKLRRAFYDAQDWSNVDERKYFVYWRRKFAHYQYVRRMGGVW